VSTPTRRALLRCEEFFRAHCHFPCVVAQESAGRAEPARRFYEEIASCLGLPDRVVWALGDWIDMAAERVRVWDGSIDEEGLEPVVARSKLGTGTNFGRRKLVPVPNFVTIPHPFCSHTGDDHAISSSVWITRT